MQNKYNNDNNIIECGIDEAGRGPLLGNVYAAAVILDSDLEIPEKLIVDSKKLSKKKRKEAYNWIINNVKNYGIGFATNEEIDKINILEATKLAMERAIANLPIKPTHYIIDGIGWEKKFTNLNVISIIKGDSKFYSIAAASILAKEMHDQHIIELLEENNELKKYDLENNMGYGTKKHIETIGKHGYSSFHRKSFIIKKT
jgi:ribonuclease HII